MVADDLLKGELLSQLLFEQCLTQLSALALQNTISAFRIQPLYESIFHESFPNSQKNRAFQCAQFWCSENKVQTVLGTRRILKDTFACFISPFSLTLLSLWRLYPSSATKNTLLCFVRIYSNVSVCLYSCCVGWNLRPLGGISTCVSTSTRPDLQKRFLKKEKRKGG